MTRYGATIFLTAAVPLSVVYSQAHAQCASMLSEQSYLCSFVSDSEPFEQGRACLQFGAFSGSREFRAMQTINSQNSIYSLCVCNGEHSFLSNGIRDLGNSLHCIGTQRNDDEDEISVSPASTYGIVGFDGEILRVDTLNGQFESYSLLCNRVSSCDTAMDLSEIDQFFFYD